jgi:hypothetical protein
MAYLAVQIARFVDDHQPGWVACEFVDAGGRSHSIIEKVPVLGSEDLDAASVYPRPGRVGCEIVNRWRDTDGRELVRITTVRPWCIESTEGLSEFVVLAEQLESS